MRRKTKHWLMLMLFVGACGGSETEGGRTTTGQRPLLPALPTPGEPTAGSRAGVAVDNPGAGIVPIQAEPPPDGSCNQDVDIVFVLDVSGSMVPPLTTLEREVTLVDQALKTKNLPSPAHFGLVIFVDTTVVLNMGMPYADVEALKVELRNQIQLTNDDNPRQLASGAASDNLTWPENALDGMYDAAAQFQWRPAETTLRTIILITDASFWDKKVASSGAESEANTDGFFVHESMHGYSETIDSLRMQKIWVNTFAAKTGGPPDGNPSPASHGQWRGTAVNVGIGYFEPYMGMPTIAESTGGFAWDIDEVYDMKISLATPINMSIEAHACEMYPG